MRRQPCRCCRHPQGDLRAAARSHGPQMFGLKPRRCSGRSERIQECPSRSEPTSRHDPPQDSPTFFRRQLLEGAHRPLRASQALSKALSEIAQEVTSASVPAAAKPAQRQRGPSSSGSTPRPAHARKSAGCRRLRGEPVLGACASRPRTSIRRRSRCPGRRSEPGPMGEYLEVVDIDPAGHAAYAPGRPERPQLLAQDGLAPSEGNPAVPSADGLRRRR